MIAEPEFDGIKPEDKMRLLVHEALKEVVKEKLLEEPGFQNMIEVLVEERLY